jgi:hypothetical protein
MDESGMAQNRRARRANVLLAATIEVAGTSTPVRMRNLSSEGALIEADQLPIEGTNVLFRKKELAVPGHVAWVKGRRAGIAFETLLEPETVLRHIPTPRPRAKLNFKRPGLGARELSPDELRFAENWVVTSPIAPLGE